MSIWSVALSILGALALFFIFLKLYALSIRPATSVQGFIVGSYEDLDDAIDQYCRCRDCSLCGSTCPGKHV